jgi:hypothetical protein
VRKVAVFVEGQTEQEFVIATVKALAGGRGIEIEVCKQSGGRLSTKAKLTVGANPQHFVLIANCATDNQVLSQIRDQHRSLTDAGYSSILGLRDAYPSITRGQLARFKSSVARYVPLGGARTSLHLAVMETEAWFLGERTHFQRIDASLTHQKITETRPTFFQQNAELFDNPAMELHTIYKIAGKAYSKGNTKPLNRVQRTINALSMEELYTNVRSELASWNEFLTALESSLFLENP